MTRRAAHTEATRHEVALVARKLFNARWYDEVSLADVASRANVSLATVTRLFPSKAKLFLAAVFAEVPTATRSGWSPGDVHGAVGILVDSFEETGRWIIRSYAVALRLPELVPIIAQTQAMTRSWIELICGPRLPRGPRRRREILDAVVVALDVRAWWVLRHEMKRTVVETKAHLRLVVDAILDRG
jgi:AcrR family transcriptional regulator